MYGAAILLPDRLVMQEHAPLAMEACIACIAGQSKIRIRGHTEG